MIKLIDLLKESLNKNINIENEIFSAYNGRYIFDVSKAYDMVKSNIVKNQIKKYTPNMMHFLSHPVFQYSDPKKVKGLEIDYDRPIGLIVNVKDPENGKTEWMLIDGNHRTRKAISDNKDANYIVIPNPEDVEKFMTFDKTKSHNLFPDDDE